MSSKVRMLPVVGLGFLCLAVIVASSIVGARLLHANQLNEGNVSCTRKQGGNHIVIIKNSKVSPWVTRASLCDSLTITNNDNELRLIAFGTHQHHQPYNGIAEQILGQGQSLVVVLNKSGTYQFHDHIHPSVVGEFLVEQ